MKTKLSLADLEAFDPRPQIKGREQRFLCPLPGLCQDKKRDNAHRALSVNLDTGAWRCWRCGEVGLILEKQGDGKGKESNFHPHRPPPVRIGPVPEPPLDHAWKIELKGAEDLTDAGLDYLAMRGITEELARSCGLMSIARWQGGGPALLFPIRRPDGALVATHGRYLNPEAEPKCKTAGALNRGVFSTPGGLTADPLIITEGPFDALSYAQCGYPAISLVGVAWGDWLPRYCAFRSVYVALDNDPRGNERSPELAAALRSRGARILRLKAQLKDANEDLLADGERKMRSVLDGVFKR